MTRKPRPEDLAPFVGRNAETHADWLDTGFRQYLIEKRDAASFPGAEQYIDQADGSLVSEVGEFLLAMPASEWPVVRRAVELLIQRTDFSDDTGAVIAKALLALAKLLNSDRIPCIIAHKALSIPLTPAGQSLFTTAFDIATQSGFTSPDATVDCLDALVRRDGLFEPSRIGRVLIGMTRAKPEHFTAHYDRLFSRLQTAYNEPFDRWGCLMSTTTQDAETRAAARRNVVRQIARLVRDDVALAYPCDPKFNLSYHESTNWWLRTLEDPGLGDIFARISAVIRPPMPRKENLPEVIISSKSDLLYLV